MKRVCDAASESKSRFVVISRPRFIVLSKARFSLILSPILLRLLDLGVHDVSIGDTIGKANVDEVKRLLDHLLKSSTGESRDALS